MIIRVLLVRSWSLPIAPVHAALAAVGIRARFVRVDIEPALNAALTRGGFDVIAHDPTTPGLSRATLDSCLRAQECEQPVVTLGALSELAAHITAALQTSRN